MKKFSLSDFKAKVNNSENEKQELEQLVGGILGHCHHVPDYGTPIRCY